LFPEEPEDGVENWLLGLTNRDFSVSVVSFLEHWFNGEPDMNYEADHLQTGGSAQGAT